MWHIFAHFGRQETRSLSTSSHKNENYAGTNCSNQTSHLEQTDQTYNPPKRFRNKIVVASTTLTSFIISKWRGSKQCPRRRWQLSWSRLLRFLMKKHTAVINRIGNQRRSWSRCRSRRRHLPSSFWTLFAFSCSFDAHAVPCILCSIFFFSTPH